MERRGSGGRRVIITVKTCDYIESPGISTLSL